MKRIILFLFAVFIGTTAIAEDITLTWLNEDGTTNQTTTCTIGGDLILPPTPTKLGYDFIGWAVDYTPIEYLEFTGTQYIDTGFYANGGCIIEARMAPKMKDGKYILQLGSISKANPNNSRNEFYSTDSRLYAEKGSITNVANILITDDTPFDLYLNTSNTKFVVKINNEIYMDRNNTNILPTQNVSVKIGYSDYSNKCFAQRNYYVKIWNSTNTLVRDFIPVLDNNGTPCMYDKVSNQYFYNAGTGDFIAGPAIP